MSEYNTGQSLSLKVIYQKKRPPGDYLIFVILKGYEKIIFVIFLSWSVNKSAEGQFTHKMAIDVMKLLIFNVPCHLLLLLKIICHTFC